MLWHPTRCSLACSKNEFQLSQAPSAGAGDLKGGKGCGDNAHKNRNSSGTKRRIPASISESTRSLRR